MLVVDLVARGNRRAALQHRRERQNGKQGKREFGFQGDIGPVSVLKNSFQAAIARKSIPCLCSVEPYQLRKNEWREKGFPSPRHPKATRRPPVALLVVACAEQVAHYVHAAVASVVQAGQAESRLHGLKEREAIIKTVALHALESIVGLDREHDLVLILRREEAVRLSPFLIFHSNKIQ